MMNMKYRSESRSKDHYLNVHESLISPLSSQDYTSHLSSDAISHLLFFFVCFWFDRTAFLILGTWTSDYFSVRHSLDFSYPSLQNLTSKSKFDSKWGLSFLRLQFKTSISVWIWQPREPRRYWNDFLILCGFFSSLCASSRTLMRISIFMTMSLSLPVTLLKNDFSCEISASFKL